MSAAAIEYGQDDLVDFKLPWPSDANCEEVCRMYRARAGRKAQQLLFRQAGSYDPNTVAFDNKTKEKLRFHLSQLRATVKKDTMPDWQKHEWYDAISELEAQIDKTRTGLGAFLDVVGKGLSGSMPVAEVVDRVIAIVKEAKLVEAARIVLAAPVAPKQLPAPKEKKNGFGKALDDEIPF